MPQTLNFPTRRRFLRGTAAPLVRAGSSGALTRIRGEAIGLEHRFGDLTFLETHHDYVDGCAHWLYLLDAQGRTLDQLRLPDTFGFIQDVSIAPEGHVGFGFYGSDDRWLVKVEPQGFWSFGWAELALRPNRKLLARRHLRVRRFAWPRFG